MRINLNEVGHFTSVAQAREYQSAMKMKDMIEGVAEEMIPYDDAVNIDYNSPGKGDILIDSLVLKTKMGEHAYEGRVIYTPESSDIRQADLKATSINGSGHETNTFKIIKEQNAETYERSGEGQWALNSEGYHFSFHDRVVIDRSAGYIDHESSHSDGKRPGDCPAGN